MLLKKDLGQVQLNVMSKCIKNIRETISEVVRRIVQKKVKLSNNIGLKISKINTNVKILAIISEFRWKIPKSILRKSPEYVETFHKIQNSPKAIFEYVHAYLVHTLKTCNLKPSKIF